MHTILVPVLAFLVHITPCAADVRLPAVIGENMVLQRETSIPLWGWADPGERVTVMIANQRFITSADENGRWQATIEPLTAGGPYELYVEGENTIRFTNILAGDVWVCGGQSNMEMRVQHCANADSEVAVAYHPEIRLFQPRNILSDIPRDDCDGSWEICRPGTAEDFSGVGYFFGRALHDSTGVPIGLINTSWYGSSAEVWMSREELESDPSFAHILDEWKPILEGDHAPVLDYYRIMGLWVEDVMYAGYVHTSLPPYATPPPSPIRLQTWPDIPMWGFNGMIAPIIPFGIKGVIWYQGEGNASRAYEYRRLFPAMIAAWRQAWGEGDFPFIYVQLANYRRPAETPGDSEWAELREAQLLTLDTPNTGMAVTIDIGEASNIHPKNKQETGRRLALCALHTVYGRDIAWSGPMFDSYEIEGDRIRIRFSHTDGGLSGRDGEALHGFAIAGADRKFVWAEAAIAGSDILVWSDAVPDPVAVRYGWADNPECNLYNGAGLPASPFRTDAWPGETR